MTANTFRRAGAPAALLLAAALGLAACAGSPGHRTAAAPPPASPPPASPSASMPGMPGMTTSPGPSGGTAAPPVAGNAVTIQNFAFSPATLTVRVGTTVTWTNRDADAHTVTSQRSGPLRSAALDTGRSYSFTFTTPGSYPYLCTIHPFMTGTVEVTR
jgi:plastocyanin